MAEPPKEEAGPALLRGYVSDGVASACEEIGMKTVSEFASYIKARGVDDARVNLKGWGALDAQIDQAFDKLVPAWRREADVQPGDTQSRSRVRLVTDAKILGANGKAKCTDAQRWAVIAHAAGITVPNVPKLIKEATMGGLRDLCEKIKALDDKVVLNLLGD